MSDAFVRRLSTTIVVVCLLALVTTLAFVVSPSLRSRLGVGPSVEQPPYAAGDQVDIEATTYASSPLSLILFARSTCAACQRSSDFHRQVVAAGTSHGIPTILVTPSTDAHAERVYADGLGIAAERVYPSAPGSIKLRAVPALMVVDATGLIRHVWFGAPDPATETTILAAVTALAGAPDR